MPNDKIKSPIATTKEEAHRIIKMKVEGAGYTFAPLYTSYHEFPGKWMGYSYESLPGTCGHPAVTVEVWDIDSLFPGQVHVTAPTVTICLP